MSFYCKSWSDFDRNALTILEGKAFIALGNIIFACSTNSIIGTACQKPIRYLPYSIPVIILNSLCEFYL